MGVLILVAVFVSLKAYDDHSSVAKLRIRHVRVRARARLRVRFIGMRCVHRARIDSGEMSEEEKKGRRAETTLSSAIKSLG